MNIYSSILKLVRIQNLLIIIATQYLMRFCIISPFLKINDFHLQLSGFHFFLLVTGTVLITAAGYVINDYFDTRTDRLNKPEKVVIDNSISRRKAIFMHSLLNLSGVGIGLYLSFYIGVPGLSLIWIIAAGLLWFYSTNYKRQFLIGNVIVSIMTGIVPVLVIIYEMPLLNRAYGEIMISANASFNYIFLWVAGFGFFAFLTTLIREIIKDSEDFEGDSAFGMNTLPIVVGTRNTKIILSFLIFSLTGLLIWVLFKFILFSADETDLLTAFYFLLFLILPSLYLLAKLITAETKKEYHFASQLTKLIMLAGLLYSFIVRYIIMNKLL